MVPLLNDTIAQILRTHCARNHVADPIGKMALRTARNSLFPWRRVGASIAQKEGVFCVR
jgi:hypothetical protein